MGSFSHPVSSSPLIDINISELNVSATIIGYDSGYLNGVLGSQDFTKIYGIRDGNTGAMCLTPYTRSTFSALFVVGALVGCQLVPLLTSRSITIAFQLVLALTVKNKIAEARRALAILRNADTNSPEVDEAILDIETHVADQHVNGSARFAECFQGTDLRRTLIGVAMSFFTISTGITFWFGYGTTFFAAAGVDNSYLISLILAITNCVFTAPSVYLIERLGRRRSLIGGGILMGLAQLLTAIIHSAAPDSKADKTMLVVGAVFFIASYVPTWGIGGWLLMAEPFSDRARNYQSSIVLTAYWIIIWLVGFVTPYMVDETAGNLGVKVSFIWVGMTVLSLVWAYTCVPELAGLSRSEIDKLFEERVPAWWSREWQRQLRTIQAVEAESDKVPTVEEKMPCKE
ncbi:High-affinity glucose transporter RGT2 [Colletotrichum sp. SAR 10_98]|nr:High-affinity glucose transporter RGT2 [Colletotrichum sp. SAR 10_98]